MTKKLFFIFTFAISCNITQNTYKKNINEICKIQQRQFNNNGFGYNFKIKVNLLNNLIKRQFYNNIDTLWIVEEMSEQDRTHVTVTFWTNKRDLVVTYKTWDNKIIESKYPDISTNLMNIVEKFNGNTIKPTILALGGTNGFISYVTKNDYKFCYIENISDLDESLDSESN